MAMVKSGMCSSSPAPRTWFALDKKIQDGYQWLIDEYLDDDEVFVIGFSRGAYTA
jgi:uncharacterized protein (DUF2235 family)